MKIIRWGIVGCGDVTEMKSGPAFAKVPHVPGTNNGGESRDVWSLRELAHTLVGPNARVVSVTGETTKPIVTAGFTWQPEIGPIA